MKALITCLIAGEYTLFDRDLHKSLIAKPRGVFRNEKISPKVGDIVEYENSTPYAIITKVEPRKNDFIRPAIANIDQALIVTSVKEPDLNLNLLDKMICAFEYQSIVPLLIFSKIDLLDDLAQEKFAIVAKYYQKIGYQVILTTTKDPLTINKLTPFLKNKISVITGQSGVGKSSMMNILDESLQSKTNEISKALNRGKHTTRYIKLYALEEGWVADSPGFGMVDLFDMDKISIAHSFVEFFKLSNECKFNGCLHQNEPSCKVKEAVMSGDILPSRYQNYLQFINEKQHQRKW